MAPKASSAASGKHVFKVDYSKPVGDSIFDAAEFEKYLHDKIKIDGKPGQLADKITIKREATKLTLTATIPFSKRSIKYYTKKYLKKNMVGEIMHPVATSKDTYSIVYYASAAADDEDEE